VNSLYDRLLTLACRLAGRRLPGRAEEMLATARAVGRTGPVARAAELLSLLAFALRPKPSRRTGRVVWLHGAAAGLVLAVLALAVSVEPLTIAVPVALLAGGVYDARLAAAATIFWLSQLLTVDLGALAAALHSVTLMTEIGRWLLMLAVLMAAVAVTQASIRRSASL
jgi:hypothetical protein